MLVKELVSFSKLNNKKYSLQFLPYSLLEISKLGKIKFKEKNLKTSIIIDIIHNLILKYFFKKDNSFKLNATVLKEKYGHLYNYYIQFLIENKIIFLEKNYVKGKNSRIYSISQDIIKGEIIRYKNFDRVLLKKYLNRQYQFQIDRNDIINRDIKSKLISDLYSVRIQYDKSIFYLDSLKMNEHDTSIYDRNRYSVEAINENHIFYHFDNYGRMHSNFTILKSFIRKNCLLIDDEETSEIDINNSQPLFLLKLMLENPYKIDKMELELFSILVRNGNYYQYLIDNLKIIDKSKAKELTYKVFFGKNHFNSKYDKYFEKLFPTIHKFIKFYKNENDDYKSLSYTLQRMESNLIFNDVVNTIMIIYPEVKIVTIHDSIIFQKKYYNKILDLFNSKIMSIFD